MSVSTIHTNAFGSVVQVQQYASGARVSDDKGQYIDIHYDDETCSWVIETPNCNVGVVICQPENQILLRKI